MENEPITIKVGIVEDHARTMKRLIEHFEFFDDLQVTISAGSGSLFLERLNTLDGELWPNVVLMDIELPGMSGIDTTFHLKDGFPGIDVIMFTVFGDNERIFQSIQAGASGYFLKEEPVDNIVDGIREMFRGGAPISKEIAGKLMNLVKHPPKEKEEKHAAPFELSERELEILERVMEGLTNKEIAAELFVSPWTIKTHIKNIYEKMHVNSRAAAVRLAMKRNMFR